MTPEISLPKEAKKIYSYDTLTEHMWFWYYKMLFCRQRNNFTTTGRALAYIFIIKKIVQTKYNVPVRKTHKGNHICLHDFSFYLRSE